jgi:hypothetical protein
MQSANLDGLIGQPILYYNRKPGTIVGWLYDEKAGDYFVLCRIGDRLCKELVYDIEFAPQEPG